MQAASWARPFGRCHSLTFPTPTNEWIMDGSMNEYQSSATEGANRYCPILFGTIDNRIRENTRNS
jgi:hypothetical protein